MQNLSVKIFWKKIFTYLFVKDCCKKQNLLRFFASKISQGDATNYKLKTKNQSPALSSVGRAAPS